MEQMNPDQLEIIKGMHTIPLLRLEEVQVGYVIYLPNSFDGYMYQVEETREHLFWVRCVYPRKSNTLIQINKLVDSWEFFAPLTRKLKRKITWV